LKNLVVRRKFQPGGFKAKMCDPKLEIIPYRFRREVGSHRDDEFTYLLLSAWIGWIHGVRGEALAV
jgi:hypothetical protein